MPVARLGFPLLRVTFYSGHFKLYQVKRQGWGDVMVTGELGRSHCTGEKKRLNLFHPLARLLARSHQRTQPRSVYPPIRPRDTLDEWRQSLVVTIIFRDTHRRPCMSSVSMTRLNAPLPCSSIAAAMRPYQVIPLRLQRALPLNIVQFLCQTKAISSPPRSQTLSDASLLILWYTRTRTLSDGLS